MIQIEIETDNAAFTCKNYEVARILLKLAEKLVQNGDVDSIKLRDVDGNTVGEFTDTEA